MEEEHPGSKFHFSPSKWFEQWPPSLTGKRMRSWTCEAGTPSVWEFPGVGKAQVSRSDLRQGAEHRLMRSSECRRAGIWSSLVAKREWSQKGREGPLKAVTKLAGPHKGWEWGVGYVGCDWGGLAMASGLMGLREGNKGFHYTILSAFVHVQHSLSKNLKKKGL